MSAEAIAVTLSDPPPLEIDPQDLADLRTGLAPYVILDVREDWETRLANFPEAVHVPLGSLAASEAALPRDRLLVVVCHHGRRSWAATRHLRSLGFTRATNLSGGIDAWATDVDPDMPRY
jgi:rhodanese-related sulfurtransferase